MTRRRTPARYHVLGWSETGVRVGSPAAGTSRRPVRPARAAADQGVCQPVLGSYGPNAHYRCGISGSKSGDLQPIVREYTGCPAIGQITSSPRRTPRAIPRSRNAPWIVPAAHWKSTMRAAWSVSTRAQRMPWAAVGSACWISGAQDHTTVMFAESGNRADGGGLPLGSLRCGCGVVESAGVGGCWAASGAAVVVGVGAAVTGLAGIGAGVVVSAVVVAVSGVAAVGWDRRGWGRWDGVVDGPAQRAIELHYGRRWARRGHGRCGCQRGNRHRHPGQHGRGQQPMRGASVSFVGHQNCLSGTLPFRL